MFGDDARQRGLADSRWPPENHRVDFVLLDRQRKRFAGADQMLLADELVKRLGADAVCERLRRSHKEYFTTENTEGLEGKYLKYEVDGQRSEDGTRSLIRRDFNAAQAFLLTVLLFILTAAAFRCQRGFGFYMGFGTDFRAAQ